MRTRQLEQRDGQRSWAVIFAAGDEAMDGLRSFAAEQGLEAASFTAIGGFSSATLAYFDVEAKRYDDIAVDEQVEVLSLVGDVTCGPDGDRKVHTHTVVGRRDGSTRGGHVRRAHVRPTLEVVLTETRARLRRTYDPDSGLALIDPDASTSGR